MTNIEFQIARVLTYLITFIAMVTYVLTLWAISYTVWLMGHQAKDMGQWSVVIMMFLLDSVCAVFGLLVIARMFRKAS